MSVWPTVWRRFLFLSDEDAEPRIDRVRRELASPIESVDPDDGRFLLKCLDAANREIGAKTQEIDALKIRNADLLSLAQSLSPRDANTILYD
jgi:hypothetical protein